MVAVLLYGATSAPITVTCGASVEYCRLLGCKPSKCQNVETRTPFRLHRARVPVIIARKYMHVPQTQKLWANFKRRAPLAHLLIFPPIPFI